MFARILKEQSVISVGIEEFLCKSLEHPSHSSGNDGAPFGPTQSLPNVHHGFRGCPKPAFARPVGNCDFIVILKSAVAIPVVDFPNALHSKWAQFSRAQGADTGTTENMNSFAHRP